MEQVRYNVAYVDENNAWVTRRHVAPAEVREAILTAAAQGTGRIRVTTLTLSRSGEWVAFGAHEV